MSEDLWDEDINTAWGTYEEALAQELDALDTDGVLVLEICDEDRAPFLQVLRLDDEFLVEVSSNRFLKRSRRLDKAARRRLGELAFTKPSDSMPNHWIPIGDGEFAAQVMVMVLRDVFGVIHPSFLPGDEIAWDQRPDPDGQDPGSPEHLRTLIDETLISLIGGLPARDDDGDIPLRVGHSVVYVLPDPSSPIVRLLGLMVDDIGDTARAEHEVNRLNQDIVGMRFVLQGRRIVAMAELPAAPFVASHLVMFLPKFCESVAANDVDLAARCAGTVLVDPPADDTPPVMRTLLELCADEPLSPQVIAQVCKYDSHLIADLIKWNSEQEIAWRQARDEAAAARDFEEAEACEYERAHAARTVKAMRKALRQVLAD